jgi:hypothetical protein
MPVQAIGPDPRSVTGAIDLKSSWRESGLPRPECMNAMMKKHRSGTDRSTLFSVSIKEDRTHEKDRHASVDGGDALYGA